MSDDVVIALLGEARKLALSGRVAEFVQCYGRLQQLQNLSVESLLEIGSLSLGCGLLTMARSAFECAAAVAPGDVRPAINLANLLLEAGDKTGARARYASLLAASPSNLGYRNAIACMQYDSSASNAERVEIAKEWARWSSARAGGPHGRPRFRESTRPLRVGYVSADFCQHTVGLLLLPVIARHDKQVVDVFAYSAGEVEDWVTKKIRKASSFREVAQLDDAQLAALIRRDQIDILIDLSGHTAGSRIAVFAHRPAPVQISWLGYFATTGLDVMDAVLLDEWHAPAGTEQEFVEPIVRLPTGRFCYRPVPWAPVAVSPPPFEKNGHITFGCFNSTAKLSSEVFDLWAKILTEVADAKLILKWRTFNDESFCSKTWREFADRGIDPARVVLHGHSFHAELLKQYGDIDIALDPFPFTGGLTSFESFWMGVPVITWPQQRAVSRQTYAILASIGLSELAAKDGDDYCRIAVQLARDTQRLSSLRLGLRQKLQHSPMLDERAFATTFERSLLDLYAATKSREEPHPMQMKTILHVGCGHRKGGAQLPPAFRVTQWREIRLDIDPGNKPDIVGSMLEMPAVADGSMDVVYSAHNIEHVYPHEVQQVLREFLRVLKPEGYAVLTCPDLQSVCALIADGKLKEVAYQSPAGPITPLDILYGHGADLAKGNHYMAHKGGFTLNTLTEDLQTAGFQTVAGKRRIRGLDIWALATKSPMQDELVRELAEQVLPA